MNYPEGHEVVVHDTGVVEILDMTEREFHEAKDPRLAMDGNCGRVWDNTVPTAWTPVPSARCPFEYEHEELGEP